jgi:hypothetical protein
MIKPAEKINAPCCGVFAAHLAIEEPDFEVTLNKARETLKRTRGWQGRMAWSEVKLLLASFGIQFETNDSPVGLTIGAASKAGLFDDGRQHVLMIHNHFLTIKNGLCYDQGFPVGKPAGQYFARRRKIKYAVKIL